MNRSALVLAFFLGLVGAASAKEYSLVELVELSLKNPDLIDLGARWQSAKLRAESEARAWTDPVIGYSLMDLGLSAGPAAEMVAHRFSLKQMIPVSGRLGLAGALARGEAEGTAAALELARRELRREIRSLAARLTFGAALEADRNREALLLRQLRDIAQGRYLTGLTSQSALLELDLKLIQAQDQAAEWRTVNAESSIRLQELAGLRGPDFRLAPTPYAATATKLSAPLELPALFEAYLANSPSRQLTKQGIQLETARRDLAAAAVFPDVGLMTELTLGPNGGAKIAFAAELSLPSLSLPAKQAELQAGDQAIAAAKAALDKVDNAAFHRLQTLINTTTLSQARLSRLAEGLKKGEDNAARLLAEYQGQKTDIETVFAATIANFDLRAQYLGLAERWYASVFELEALCGLSLLTKE